MLATVMGSAHLSFWPQVALVIFFSIFVGAILRTSTRARVEEFKRAALLPLDDERKSNV